MTAEKLSCLTPDSVEIQPTGEGKLSGKTFVVKDLVAIKGHMSSFGNAQWRATHSANKETSVIVTKLLDQGAHLVGTAKQDQLAGSLVGNISEGDAPINSLYPDRFAGGSSSGSASAVSGGMVDFAIGTDTAGSVRVPAAACGLYGLRPTYDAIKKDGVLPWGESFDTVGVLSKDLQLVRSVFEILQENQKPAKTIKRILASDALIKLASPEAVAVTKKFAQDLANAHGLKLENIDLSGIVGEKTRDLFSRIAGRENWQAHGEWITANKKYLAPDLLSRMEGAEQRAADPVGMVQADQQERSALKQKVSTIIDADTILITPVIYDLPPKITATPQELFDYRMKAVQFNALAGLCGLPELVVPVKNSESGLIYGVGIVGSSGSDSALIDFALT